MNFRPDRPKLTDFLEVKRRMRRVLLEELIVVIRKFLYLGGQRVIELSTWGSLDVSQIRTPPLMQVAQRLFG